jgi:hypothetical protein
MLTQVRFLAGRADGAAVAPASSADGAQRPAGAGARVAIAARVLEGDQLWVYDPVKKVALQRTIERGAPFAGDGATELVEVRAGLALTDKVIDGGRAALVARGDAGGGVPVRVVEGDMDRGNKQP